MTAQLKAGPLSAIRRYLRESRAVSAVEFALLAPLMLVLLLGGTELTEAITIKRKTILVTRTIADLVSQATTINDTDIESIFKAANAVLSPFPDTNLKMTVSSIGIDGAGNTKIIWSDAYNGADPHTDDDIALPTGIALPNTSIIWAEAEYSYTPLFGHILTQAMFPNGIVPLKDHVYLRPRLKNYICRDTGSQVLCS